MLGFIFFKSIWASCIIAQSNQPLGEAIISNSACVSLPNDLCLLAAGVEFITFFTNSMSFVELVVEEATCPFLEVFFFFKLDKAMLFYCCLARV